MTKSLISNEKECLICKTTKNLHRHHIYAGLGQRDLSEKHGCWVYLCANHHNASKWGVHNYKPLDINLKRRCQIAWEEKNGDRDEFIKVFGRSYL